MTTPGPDHGHHHGHHHGARPELHGLDQVEVAVASSTSPATNVLTEMCGDQEFGGAVREGCCSVPGRRWRRQSPGVELTVLRMARELDDSPRSKQTDLSK